VTLILRFQGNTVPALKKVEVPDFIKNEMRSGRSRNENDDREYTKEKSICPVDGFSSLDDFRIVNDLLSRPGKGLATIILRPTAIR